MMINEIKRHVILSFVSVGYNNLSNIVMDMFEFSKYPLTIFSKTLRAVMTIILSNSCKTHSSADIYTCTKFLCLRILFYIMMIQGGVKHVYKAN